MKLAGGLDYERERRGRGLIAKAIHQHIAWRDGPFVAINCGAIPEGLVESELLDHRIGD
jgi:transcriptional regulator with PAS, ATPase and Fis domain